MALQHPFPEISVRNQPILGHESLMVSPFLAKGYLHRFYFKPFSPTTTTPTKECLWTPATEILEGSEGSSLQGELSSLISAVFRWSHGKKWTIPGTIAGCSESQLLSVWGRMNMVWEVEGWAWGQGRCNSADFQRPRRGIELSVGSPQFRYFLQILFWPGRLSMAEGYSWHSPPRTRLQNSLSSPQSRLRSKQGQYQRSHRSRYSCVDTQGIRKAGGSLCTWKRTPASRQGRMVWKLLQPRAHSMGHSHRPHRCQYRAPHFQGHFVCVWLS